MELLDSDSVTESKHLGPMSPVSVSTEAVSPDAPSSADTTDRSCCSPTRLPVPWLDAEVLESAATFAHLPVPRERSGIGGLDPSSDSLPTVLGRARETSKSSSKSVAMQYNFAPSSPHSILTVPAPSYMARAWRREQGGGCEAAISNASGETHFGVRKWSIGVRTLLQLGDSHFADWLSFLALTTMVFVATALYAVVMAPRDHEATIAWRRENPSVHVDKLGCDAVDHIGFYLILCVATFAGVAACLMFRNAGGSAHILSASGLALLSWFQGLVATVLPAHERAKSGCAYGTMQKIFAPQELSSYDRADYYKDYYGVIIVRTLLFLATLIWMQHLMVWRVQAVEATSRRFFGGRCLAVGIAVQKVAATVALAVSIWTYTSIGASQTSSDEPFGAEVAESAITAHVKFWNNCVECEPYTGLMALQLILGGMNFLLFVATGVTVIIIMSVILWDLGQAVRVTNDFTSTHPRARRAGQQLRRARAVVRWQLFGVMLHLVASSALLPVALEKLLDGRGYRSEPDLAISCSFQAMELLTCVSAALILSGGYRRPIRHRSRADQPCSWQFATADSADSVSMRREKTASRELSFERSSTAWNMKVAEIAGRGITVKELLGFYRDLRDVMPHYKASVHTTGDVVRHAIIPMTKESRSSYVQAFEGAGRSGRPQKMVTHWWGNRFVDLCAAVVADVLEESSYGLVSRLLQKDVDIIERILEKCGRLHDCYWICAFCVNQHASICDCNHHSRDSLTAQRYPVCDCGLPKYYEGDECEMNKFDEMMAFLAARDPNFCQVVAVDAEFGVFGRAWCMAEMAQASKLGIRTHLKLRDKEGLVRTGAKLRDLDVREMEASREEDVVHILAKIPDTDAFNASLQSLIFDSRSGLLAAWRDLDSSRQMGEAGRLLFWISADSSSTGVVWKCWEF